TTVIGVVPPLQRTHSSLGRMPEFFQERYFSEKNIKMLKNG
ncbi:25287_t:CDS:1, partial [Dentiscutata erythropus]